MVLTRRCRLFDDRQEDSPEHGVLGRVDAYAAPEGYQALLLEGTTGS